MRFNCGPSKDEKINRLTEWHRFFAILPVRVGSHDCRFLEVVFRKGVRRKHKETLMTICGHHPRHSWSWEYKALPPVPLHHHPEDKR